MYKFFTIAIISCCLSGPVFPQIADRFGFLTEDDMREYAGPFGTSLGMAFNSASYHSAKVSEFFGFSFSLRGMFIFIPDADRTFTPTLPAGYSNSDPTATIYGAEGTAYYGPDGYIVYPPGVNETTIPFALPQISASFMGTEVMLRYLPSISLGDKEDLSMFGIGLKHSISRYIPLSPVDISVQLLYNNLEITGVMDITAFAFNAHASKSLGLFDVYGGLQYETSSFKTDYTYDGYIESLKGTEIKVEINGDNKFRGTLGAALKLALLVFNIDFSLGTQSVLSGGLTFEF
jgi:hypothetical protein